MTDLNVRIVFGHNVNNRLSH